MRYRGTLRWGLGPAALCALALAGPAAAGTGPSYDVPLVGTAPTIDGAIGTPEWDSAHTFPVSFGSFTGTAHVERTATDLYFAYTVGDPAGPADSAVYFDNNDDGVLENGEDFMRLNSAAGSTAVDGYLFGITVNSYNGALDTFDPAHPGTGTEDVTAVAKEVNGVYTIEYKRPLCSGDNLHDFCFAPPATFDSPASKLGFTVFYGTGAAAVGDPAGVMQPAAYANFVIQPPPPPSPPPAPTITLHSDDAGHAAESLSFNGGAYNVWYRPTVAVSGNFTLSVPANDDAAGITSASFPAFEAGGWSLAAISDPRSEQYSFTPNPGQPPSITVTDTDANGLSSPGRTVGFTPDSSPPTGGFDCRPIGCANTRGGVVLRVDVNDPQSGTEELRYTLDGSTPGPDNGTMAAPGATIRVTTPSTTVKLWGIDHVGNAGQIASASVSGAPDPPTLTWNYADDFQTRSNPGPDLYGNAGVWTYGEAPVATPHDPSSYTTYPVFDGSSGEQCWHSATTELLTPDACVLPGTSPLGTDVDPASTRNTLIRWTSPITGNVSVTGGVRDSDPACGDGINWILDNNQSPLAAGTVTNGGSAVFAADALSSISVVAGDTITLLVGPGGGTNYFCDSTAVDLTITQLAPPPPPSPSCGVLANCGFEQALNAPKHGTSIAGGSNAVPVSYGNWQPYYMSNNTVPPDRSTAQAHAGSYSGYIVTSASTDPGGNGSEYWQDAPTTFDPNQGYILDAWVYPVAGQTQVSLAFDSDRDAGTQSGSAGVVIDPASTNFSAWGQGLTTPALAYNQWHELKLEATAGSHTSTLTVDGTNTYSITATGSAVSFFPNFTLPQTSVVLGATCGGCSGPSIQAYYDNVSLVQLSPPADPAQPGPTYTVNTADDHADAAGCTAADCTLREALAAANRAQLPATIDFAILSGLQTISLRSPLPASAVPVTIDGTSQPGVLAGPGIALDGGGIVVSEGPALAGLTLRAGASTVRGLAFESFRGNGIVVSGAASHILGNVIGTTPDGTGLRANGGAGIKVDGGAQTEITGNLVSGSVGPGILVTGSSVETRVMGNRIGTDASGNPADEGNRGAGIRIDAGSPSTKVGGFGRGDGNRIADNAGAGVSVGSSGNAILGNSIEGNGGGGIDLGTTGNLLQAPPLIAAARVSGSTISVVGKFLTPGGTYRLEFFTNTSCPESGPTEGARFIGSSQVVLNAGGAAAVNATLEVSNVTAGLRLTATATSSSGNTSPFSRCVTVTAGGTASSATLDLQTNTATTQPGAAVIPLADIPSTAFGNTSIDANGATASAPLGAIPLGAIPLGAIPLGAIPLGAIPLGAIGFTPQALLEDGLGGVPLNTIPLKAPLSWETELQGTPLAGLPTQTLTLRDVLSLTPPPSNLTTAGPNAVGLKSLDLSLSPLGAIPLGAIALGSSPLGAIPISGDKTRTSAQNVADWCTQIRSLPGFGATDCATLATQTVMGAAIQGVPLGAIPLGAIPLGAIPLGAIPLGAIPLGAIDLAGSPLGAIPLGAISLGATPLGAIPLGAIPLGAIPLGAIPLGAIPVLSHVVDCALGFSCAAPGATLAAAAAANAIKASATLADLGMYGSATLGDLAAYLQAHPEIQLKDVVPGLPDTVTLRDLLAALMGGTPPSWEQFPLDGLQDFANGAGALGGVVTYSANFAIQGAGSAALADLAVTMPAGARYVPGSAVLTDLTARTTRPVGDPVAGGAVLTWTFDTLSYGDSYALAFKLRPGFQLGNEHAVATLSTAGVANHSAQADVTVGDTFESNNTPSEAPTIAAATLYVSYLGNGKDIDYSSFPINPGNAPAGTRIKIFLSHLGSDADLAVFGPVDPPLRSAPLGAIPLGAIPAGEQAVQPGEQKQQLAPDTAQDLPFGALPAGDQLLGVSDNRGTTNEEIDFTSTGQTGALLIQVSSYDGHPTTDPYVVRVELDPPPALPPCTQTAPSGVGQTHATLPTAASIPQTAQTLILFNEQRLGQYYSAARAADVYTKLVAYAARSDVRGVIVPVELDTGVAGAYTTWNGSLCSPAAANGVVRAIGALLDSLQAGHPNLKTIVVGGADNIIPSARVLDQTQQANELGFRSTFGLVNNEYVGAVAAGYLLTDDPYADPDPQALLGGYLYVPKLALGRLVETPEDIGNQLTAYAASNGLANPQTKLVSGYDFLTDGAQAVDAALGRTAPIPNLISDTWTADAMRNALFPATGPVPLLDSLNAHYDQHRALSAQGNAIHDESAPSLFTTTDVASRGASGVIGRIVFTMGCHAGFSLFDALPYFTGATPTNFALDWPQAYMEGGAIEFLGNTGYGLGDTAAVAYSERLNQLFAQRLNGTMSVGEALAFAKQEYFGGLGVVSLYDAKVGNEATLYGIPTYRLGNGTPPAAPPPAPTQTDTATGLMSLNFSTHQNFTLHSPTLAGTPLGNYYSADDPNGAGQQVTNRRPIEPSTSVDVTEPGATGHGVLITALTSQDVAGFTAAFGRVADDLSAIEPQLQGIVDFPASIQSLATIATPNGQRQRAVLIAGHFTSSTAPGVGKQRLYDTIGGTVFFSPSIDFVRPTITNMQVLKVGSTVGFAADVADLNETGAAGIVKQAIVLYLDASGSWQRANLTCSSGHCSGGGPLSGTSVDYVAEAVDAAGNVGVNANKASAINVTVAGGSPHLSISFGGAVATGGWYTAPVTATLASDDGATIGSSLDGGAFRNGTTVLVSGDGLHTLDVRGSDGSAATFAIPIDLTAPTAAVTTPHDGAILFIGDRYLVDYACADGGAGIAASGGCVGTLPVGAQLPTLRFPGTYTFSVRATDAVGRTSTVTSTYVLVPGIAFLPPTFGGPVLNIVKAGNTIPVTFSLLSNLGLNIFDPGYPRSQQVACPTGLILHTLDNDAVTTPGLRYNARTTVYTYGFTTDASWAGTCRELTVKFRYGSVRKVQLKFK